MILGKFNFHYLIAFILIGVCSGATLHKREDLDTASYFWCDGKPADIFFLLDSSTSIWPKDFKKQLTFVENLVQSFPISPEETRVAIGSFASFYRKDISFDDYGNATDLIQAIRNLRQLYGNTNTAKALQAVRETFRGARQDAAHLAVVLTDGESMAKKKTKVQAKLLKEAGVEVFAIGIGGRINKMELVNIGSQPSERFVQEVKDFDALENIRNNIRETLAYQVCKVEALKHEPYCSASVETDVIFAYDAVAMGTKNARKVQSFIGDVVSNFGNMEDKTLQAGVLSGYCKSKDIHLNQFSDKNKFKNTLTNHEHRGLDQIVQELHRHGFDESRGGRATARRMAVVFVDDSTEKTERLLSELDKTRKNDIEVLVVSVGNAIDKEFLTDVVGKPEYVVSVPSYQEFELIKDEYVDKFCKGLKL